MATADTTTRTVAIKARDGYHVYTTTAEGVKRHAKGPFPKATADKLAAAIVKGCTIDLAYWETMGTHWVETSFARAELNRWFPTEEPWRVCVSYRTNQPGCHGWATRTKTYANEAEAHEAAQAEVQGRNIIDVQVDYAENADNWQRRGKWRLVRKLTPMRKGTMKKSEEVVEKGA